MQTMLRYIIFAPLAGAAINWLIGRRVRNELFIGLVACASVGISTILGFYLAFKSNGALRSTQPLMDHLWTWLQVGNFRADFGLAMDRLSGIYVLFITFVGFWIHLFAAGYMRGDRGYYRFFAYLNLFMFAMLTLVLADNFLLMFVGWEGVGLCSYLLIGYYLDRDEAAPAAKKAFIANRVGDWGFVLGIMLVFFFTSSLGKASISFFDKPAYGVASALNTIAAIPSVDPFSWHAIFAGGITSIAVLLFIGATGKSAQIPLFVWLPDAMAGPTPVSPLIHAATMVTAGVYVVVRSHQIFEASAVALTIVAVVGIVTAIYAGFSAIGQDDIKRMLAYSTISQLGFMFFGAGMGAYSAAIFLLVAHAFFKALLFLGAGSVMHALPDDETDMTKMGGLWRAMPITAATWVVGWLAMAGLPPLSGFFAKDQVVAAASQAGRIGLWYAALFGALLTALYETRGTFLTFFGEPRHDGHPHDPPARMRAALLAL